MMPEKNRIKKKPIQKPKPQNKTDTVTVKNNSQLEFYLVWDTKKDRYSKYSLRKVLNHIMTRFTPKTREEAMNKGLYLEEHVTPFVSKNRIIVIKVFNPSPDMQTEFNEIFEELGK